MKLLIMVLAVAGLAWALARGAWPGRRVPALLLLLAVALPALAGAYTPREASGVVEVAPAAVWYEPVPGPAQVLVGGGGVWASVLWQPWNRALLIGDYSPSWGVVAKRTFVAGLDYDGVPQGFNFTWRVLGYRFLGDPGWVGLVLGEVSIGAGGSSYFISAYAYREVPDTIILSYNDGGNYYECGRVEAPEWGVELGIEGDFGAAPPVFRVRVGGVVVCEFTLNLDPAGVVEVGFGAGRYDWGNSYELFLDDVALRLETSAGVYTVREDFDDGFDSLFSPVHGPYWWHDTYYTSPTGSTPDPPPDATAGLAIVTAATGSPLASSTSLPAGTTIPSWMEAPAAACDKPLAAKTVPIRIDETAGQARGLAWINITLDDQNFNDWPLLAPDASSVYFTLPSGQVLPYRLAEIDTAARRAVFQVQLFSLPANTSTTILLHYGGVNPYPEARQPGTATAATGVRVGLLPPFDPLLVEYKSTVSGAAWTVQELLASGATILYPATSRVTLTVGTSAPNLSQIHQFLAAPPGQGSNCTLSVDDHYLPSGVEGVVYTLHHNLTVAGGVLAPVLLHLQAGFIADTVTSGDPLYVVTDNASSRYHWVYLDLAAGTYEFMRIKRGTPYPANGTLTIITTGTIDLSTMTYSEKYALGPVLVFVNPYAAAQDYTITIIDANGNPITFQLPALTDNPGTVMIDLVLAWEERWWPDAARDFIDNYADHVVRVTVFANGTARSETLYARARFLHMYLFNTTLPPFHSIPAILQEYDNNGYTLDPAYGVRYVKPRNTEITNDPTVQVWDPNTGTWTSPPLVYTVQAWQP